MLEKVENFFFQVATLMCLDLFGTMAFERGLKPIIHIFLGSCALLLFVFSSLELFLKFNATVLPIEKKKNFKDWKNTYQSNGCRYVYLPSTGTVKKNEMKF